MLGHRVRPSGDGDRPRWHTLGVGEVFLEERRIDSCAHQDDLQRLAACLFLCQQLLEHHKEQISVDVALVHLVNNDVRNFVERRVIPCFARQRRLQLLQENTYGAERD